MNPTEKAIRDVAEKTLASLAFMFPMEDAGGDAGEMVTATVGFSGPLAGTLIVSAGAEMLDPLAANMLGLDDGEALSGDQRLDAFRELANVICGNLLPVVASPRDVFNVHEPQMVEPGQTPTAPDGRAPAGQVELAMDEGCLRLALLLDASPAAVPAGGGSDA